MLDDYFDYGGAARATDELISENAPFEVLRDSGHRALIRN